jgi:hypothetical protein
MGGLFSLFGGSDAPKWQNAGFDLNAPGRIGSQSTQINDLGLALSGYNRMTDPNAVAGERQYITGLQQDATRRMQMQLSSLAMGSDQARSMGLSSGAGWRTSGLLGGAMRKNELAMAMDRGMQMDTSNYDMMKIGLPLQYEAMGQGYLGQYLQGQAQQTGFGLQKASQVSQMGQEMAMFNAQNSYQAKMADWQNKQSFTNSMLGGLMGIGSSVLGNMFAPSPTTNIYG